MKAFESLVFDAARCREEVGELKQWLARRPKLEERRDILPFFRKRRQLSAFIASSSPNITCFDRIAFEYPLFGDFTCDLVVGDSVKHAYCFIEFEGAGPSSLFIQRGKKATREWSPHFDHGYSQIIDWFYKLDDMRKSDDFHARFGSRAIRYGGILIIGREDSLWPGERERLDWRQDQVVVGSQKVLCVTFDGLLKDLQARLETFTLTAEAEG